MNGTEIGIFKEGNQVSFSGLLEGENSLALESDFLFELGRDLTDQSLEGKFSDEQVSLNEGRKGKESSTMMVESSKVSYAFLEFSDLSQSNRSRFESVGLLDAGHDGSGLSGDFLGSQLLAGHLLCRGLTGSLFCSGHHQ